MKNFMQIRPRGGASPQMGEIYAKIASYTYTFFLQRTYRPDPLGDFYARWLKRRGLRQRSVHGRPLSSGGKSRLHPASVRWRLSNLHQHAGWRCCGDGWPFFPLSWWCWSLVELKPTATKPSQDASLVAGLQVPTAQAQHSRRSSPINIRQDCLLSTWPGSGHWQWLNDVWPHHCSLLFDLLPAASATNDCAIVLTHSLKYFKVKKIWN